MLTIIKELFSLLTAAQRKRFYRLQILVVVVAFAEIAAVASIGPFMALIGDFDLLQRNNLLAMAYHYFSMSDPHQFAIWLGAVVLLIIALSALLSTYGIWRVTLFSVQTGTQMSERLFQYYINQPWLFHAQGNSTTLIKRILTDANIVTHSVLTPVMNLAARSVMVSFMLVAVFIFNPLVAVCAFSLFAITYGIIFRTVRSRLLRNGQILSRVSGQRHKLLAEGFGGIKDVLLLGRQSFFLSRFQSTGADFARSTAINQTLGQIPRYVVELIAYCAILLLAFYLIKQYQGNLGNVLATLSIYALAGFKLLPSFQNIYISIASIKGGQASYAAIRDDLINSLRPAEAEDPDLNAPLALTRELELKDIRFAYPGKPEGVLSDLTMTIPANKTIGIAGPSGAGKSTVIDLILGLIEPDQGQILIDGRVLASDTRRSWQRGLGFVPQSIFLADCSIRDNIAFGLAAEEIDDDRVRDVIRLAHLEEMIKQLPDGMDTNVGERGVQLSGGQRQRIGIARSLYQNASLLIFDEATSALDGITEKSVMDAIHDFSGTKTIVIVAHRLKTIEKCDTIFLLEQGRIAAAGSYSELYASNDTFRKMADHA